MVTRSAKFETDHRLLAIAAARLRGESGLTQAQIAARLDKSQPEVSRLLAYAKKHEFLARSPSFVKAKVDAKELEEADRRFFVNEELRDALRALAPKGLRLNVHVLPDGEAEFTTAAAACVVELLQQAHVIGLMWGRRIKGLVASVQAHLGIFAESRPSEAQCIPLCGDPAHLMNLRHVKYSASHLAAELGQSINPDRPSDQPCLVGVPAYLPRSSAAATWEHFVQDIPGYREIFGPTSGRARPWVERIDTIITGTGIISPAARRQEHGAAVTAAHEETGDFIRERLEQEADIEEPDLARLIYGDIGGWLLARPNLRPAERSVVKSLNQGWTGIKGTHLESVARNATAGGSPGIILLAAGPAKADMVRELVRLGLVNEILVDLSLGKALKPRRRA
jgi:DNA-binding transcriptional regulator LsrR (DeoR family)